MICNKNRGFSGFTAFIWIDKYLEMLLKTIDNENEGSITNMKSIENNADEFKNTMLPRIPEILKPILSWLYHGDKEFRRAAEKINKSLLQIMQKVKSTSGDFANLFPVVKEMLNEKNTIVEYALVWMDHLFRIYPEKLLTEIDSILSRLFEKLSDAEGPVLQGIMKILGTVCVHDQYFDLIIEKILYVFHDSKVCYIYM
jgi:hypothetical protein